MFVLLGALLLFLGNKWIDHTDAVAKQKADADTALLKQAIAQNQDYQATVTETLQKSQQLINSLTTQNDALLRAIATRNTAVQKQQQKDRTLPQPDLASHWAQLLHLPNESVQSVNGTIVLNDVASRATVQNLDLIPVLQQNYADVQKISANKDKQIASLSTVVTDLQTQVGGLKTQIAAQDKSFQSQIAELKADDRKKKRNWFVTGLVTGGGAIAWLILH